jgi:hypothetical protein
LLDVAPVATIRPLRDDAARPEERRMPRSPHRPSAARRLAIPLLAALLVGIAAPALAQSPSPAAWTGSAGGAIGAAIVPGGAVYGPPTWVRPGLRLVYYGGAASVAQSSYTFVEDPNGTWQDPATGKTYRRTDETGEGMGAGGGDGVSYVDVLAVDGTDVVIRTALLPFDRINNRFLAGPAGGDRYPGGAVDGAWLNPDLLATLVGTNTTGFQVLTGPYPLNGTTYQAVSFVNSRPGAYSSDTYDSKTGLLLVESTSTQGQGSPVHAPGEPAPLGNTELTYSQLLSARDRNVPGTGSPLPGWLGSSVQLQYGGTYTVTNPLDPSSLTITWPMTMTVTLTPGGPDWASVASHTEIDMNGVVQRSDSTSTTNGAGSWWLGAEAIAGMRAGQELDTDPITQERLVVADVAGDGSVTIDDSVAGIAQRLRYDGRTGVMVDYQAQLASTGTTVALQLQAGP